MLTGERTCGCVPNYGKWSGYKWSSCCVAVTKYLLYHYGLQIRLMANSYGVTLIKEERISLRIWMAILKSGLMNTTVQHLRE